MADERQQSNFCVVELNPQVLVRTSLPPISHSALRAGFAGYTDNPRWTPLKRQAWKQGRQWREAIAQGQLSVREADGMLLTADAPKLSELPPPNSDRTPPAEKGGFFQSLLGWSRKKPAIN
jgi:hypothetical protein